MQFAQILFDGTMLLLFVGGCVLVSQSLRAHRQTKVERASNLRAQDAEVKKPEVLDAQKVAAAPAPTFPASVATWDIAVDGSNSQDNNRLASSVSAAVFKSRKPAAAVPPRSS